MNRAGLARAGRFLPVAALMWSLVPGPAAADESAWLWGLVTRAIEQQTAAAAYGQELAATATATDAWSVSGGGGWRVVPQTGYVVAEPTIGVAGGTAEPGSAVFAWNLAVDGLAVVRRPGPTATPVFDLGLRAAAALEFRLATGVEGRPQREKLLVELDQQNRVDHAGAVALVLEAALLATQSAIAAADSEYAQRAADFQRLESRRLAIELESGRVSRAAYLAALDELDRSLIVAADAEFEAERLGRMARRAGGFFADASAEQPPTAAAFAAADLVELADLVEGLLDAAEPAVAAGRAAAAEWHLRLLDYAAANLTQAPQLVVSTAVELLPDEETGVPTFTWDGNIGLRILLDPTVAGRQAAVARARQERERAAEAAFRRADAEYAESLTALALWQDRIVELGGRVERRRERLAAWTRLAAEGAAAELDVVAARASYQETVAAVERAQAGRFWAVMSAFGRSGLAVADLDAALATRGGTTADATADSGDAR